MGLLAAAYYYAETQLLKHSSYDFFHDEEVTQRISDRFNSRSSYDQSARVNGHQTSAPCRMDGEWTGNTFSWYSSPYQTTMVRL